MSIRGVSVVEQTNRALPPLSTRLEGKELVLRPPRATDVPEVRKLLRKNAEHLRAWSPMPRSGEDPSSLTEISKAILRQRREWMRGESFVFLMTSRAENEAVIGRIALGGVMRGAFLNAYLGYWIDVDHQARGHTTEAVAAVVSFAFRTAGLHRIQAAVMPRNGASLRVLAKVGFRKEGESARYLQIAGLWEDHQLFAVTAEEWLR